MDTLQHQIALTLMPQIGAVTTKTLVAYCGSAAAVFKTGRKYLQKIPGIGPALATALADPTMALKAAERELRFMEQQGIQAVFFTDPAYPARLKQCADGPALFYFQGSASTLLEHARILAVIGTRQPSDQGRAICEEIVEGFKPYNVLIVSGLAFGIDVTAHRKASLTGIPNIGVLGHGLGTIYPLQHRSVAQRMLENGGLISEYVHDAKPDREHFPMRNRIISGLSDAVLVVETASSGGSMITVQYAERHGREIFAVPGRPHDARSLGCNGLIKNERAKLAESAADIAYRMQWDEPVGGKAVQIRLFTELSAPEAKIVDIIRSKPEIPIDQLTLESGMAPGDLAARILELEFKGVLRTLPGKRYVVLG